MSEFMSFLLVWSESSEKNLPIFYLESKILVVNVLEAEWESRDSKFIPYSVT